MYLLNGESKHCIEFLDRGFQYGDGLFETIEVIDGTPVFLDQHLQRLDLGCKKLLIPTPDLSILKQEAFQLAKDSDHAVLKLIVTRGSGGRGYRQPDKIHPTRLFSLHPYPTYPEELITQGINVFFCNTQLGISPSLAGIKHLNRLEQVLARAEWSCPDIHEGLMVNYDNHVVEGTMSNVFIVKDDCLYTPEITQSGVRGVLRDIIIELAKELKIPVIETVLSKDDIYKADELFITNSIIGIWPVKQLVEQTYNVGLITSKLQTLFLQFKKQTLDSL